MNHQTSWDRLDTHVSLVISGYTGDSNLYARRIILILMILSNSELLRKRKESPQFKWCKRTHDVMRLRNMVYTVEDYTI
jgi:hypothetical protein